jgi:D-alanine-D-alanine ligase
VAAKQSGRRPELYEEDGFHRFPIEEIETGVSSTPGVYGYTVKAKDLWEQGSVRINCPALLESGFEERLRRLAMQAHQAIGAKDISRVDIRLDSQGEPKLVEINTLPGLAPDFSDLCLMWNAEGLLYKDLILEILYLAASRFNLAFSIPGTISQRVAIYPNSLR